MCTFYFTYQIEKQLENQLFKLYHNENDIKRLSDELSGRNEELKKSVEKREGVEERIRGKKKELGQLTRELAAIEKDTREKVCLSMLLLTPHQLCNFSSGLFLHVKATILFIYLLKQKMS